MTTSPTSLLTAAATSFGTPEARAEPAAAAGSLAACRRRFASAPRLTAVGLAPVDAGAKTLFVCYAESPRELADKSPALAAKLGEGASLSPAKDSHIAP